MGIELERQENRTVMKQEKRKKKKGRRKTNHVRLGVSSSSHVVSYINWSLSVLQSNPREKNQKSGEKSEKSQGWVTCIVLGVDVGPVAQKQLAGLGAAVVRCFVKRRKSFRVFRIHIRSAI